MALSRKISSSIQGVVTSAWNTAARGMGTHTGALCKLLRCLLRISKFRTPSLEAPLAGTVKFFQPKKGFGFLTTESEPGKDGMFVYC